MSDANRNERELMAIFYKHYRRGEILNSIIVGEKLLLLYRTEGKTVSSEYADLSFCVASCYEKIGKLDRAVYHYLKCIGVTEKISGLKTELVDRMNNLAICYGKMDKPGEALAFFVEILKMRRLLSGDNSMETAEAFYNLGNALYDCGKYEEAIKYHTNALKKLTGYERIDCLNSIGYCYEKLEDYQNSLKYLEEALELICKEEGKESFDYLANTIYLAQLCAANKDMERMYNYYKKSLVPIEKNYTKKHPYYANILGCISEYFSFKGESVKSIDLKIKALNILKNAVGKNFMYHANSLKNIAIALYSVSDSKRGSRIFKEALSIKEELIGIECWEYIFDSSIFFHFLLDEGKYEEIVKFGKKLFKSKRMSENDATGINFRAFYNESLELRCNNGDLSKAQEYLKTVNEAALTEIIDIYKQKNRNEIDTEGGAN